MIISEIIILLSALFAASVLLIYVERKLIAAVRLKKIARVYGLMQPIADAFKLFFNETILPRGKTQVAFMLLPVLFFTSIVACWAVIPVDEGVVLADINAGALFLVAMFFLSICLIVVIGWASDSKYAMFGALHSVAMMVAYELSAMLAIVCVLISSGSMRLSDIVNAQAEMWYCLPHFPMFVVFFIYALVRTNCPPFRMSESGNISDGEYSIEYTSVGYIFIAFARYVNMLLMSAVITVFFLGGWLPPFEVELFLLIPSVIWFGLKMSLCLLIFIFTKTAFPIYRYDNLVQFGWKMFLPFSLVWVIAAAGYTLVSATGKF